MAKSLEEIDAELFGGSVSESPSTPTGPRSLDEIDAELFSEPEERSEFVAGLKAGIDQTQGLGYGAVGLAGDLVGSESLSEWGRAGYQRNMAEAAENPPNVRFTEIEGLGDAGTWAAYTFGNLIPTMATLAGSGGIGGMAGKYAVRKGVQSALKEGNKLAAARLAGQGAKWGAGAGAGLGSTALEGGGIHQEIIDETGQTRPWVGLTFGALAGAFDAVPVVSLLHRLGLGRRATEDIAKRMVEQGLVKSAATQAGIQAVYEGSTEAAQTVIQKMALKWVEDHREIFTPENWAEIIDAAAAGTLMGVTMGGASGAAGYAMTPHPIPQKEPPPDDTPPDDTPEGALDSASKHREKIEGMELVEQPADETIDMAGDVDPEIQTFREETQDLRSRVRQRMAELRRPDFPMADQVAPGEVGQLTEPLRPDTQGYKLGELPPGETVEAVGGAVQPMTAADVQQGLDRGEIVPDEQIDVLGPETRPTAEGLDVEYVPSVDEAAHQAIESPRTGPQGATDAQVQADNYRKGHLTERGMRISIENPAGSIRRSRDKDNPWETMVRFHYGHILGTKGADGEPIDVFLGPLAGREESDYLVYVINQKVPESGRFDEEKVMAGFPSEEAAQAAYLSNYPQDWLQKQGGRLSVETFPSMQEFNQWAQSVTKMRRSEAQSERAKERERIDVTQDSMADAVAKLGGLDARELGGEIDEGLRFKYDKRGRKQPVTAKGTFLPVVRQSGGHAPDRMAEKLYELGYPVVDAEGNYDPNVMYEALNNEAHGQAAYSVSRGPEDFEREMDDYRDEQEEAYQERLSQEWLEEIQNNPDADPQTPQEKELAVLIPTAQGYDEDAAEAIADQATVPDEQIIKELKELIASHEKGVQRGSEADRAQAQEPSRTPGEPEEGARPDFELTPQQAPEEAPAQEEAQGDLLPPPTTGEQVRKVQTDRRSEQEQAPSMDEGEGDLFSDKGRQVDVEDRVRPNVRRETSGESDGNQADTTDQALSEGLREAEQAWARVLPGVPRRVYEELAAEAPRLAPGGATESELQELRQRIQEAGETAAEAVRGMWGPGGANAPRRLRQAAGSDVAVSRAPSGEGERQNLRVGPLDSIMPEPIEEGRIEDGTSVTEATRQEFFEQISYHPGVNDIYQKYDARDGLSSRQLNKEDIELQRAVLSAMERLIQMGLPIEVARLPDGLGTMRGDRRAAGAVYSAWTRNGQLSTTAVLINPMLGTAEHRAEMYETLAHELGHVMAKARGPIPVTQSEILYGRDFTRASALFKLEKEGLSWEALGGDEYVVSVEKEAMGPVMREMYEAWDEGKEGLRRKLNYPFESIHQYPTRNTEKRAELLVEIQQETWAQAVSLYYTHPKRLKKAAPKTHALVKEVDNAYREIGEDRSRNTALRESFQTDDSLLVVLPREQGNPAPKSARRVGVGEGGSVAARADQQQAPPQRNRAEIEGLPQEAEKYETFDEFYRDSAGTREGRRQYIRQWRKENEVEPKSSDIDRGDGIHSPASPQDGAPLYDVSDGIYPEDVYGPNGLRYYGTGEDAMDSRAYGTLMDAEGNPEKRIKVYRAVEPDGRPIGPGDWVTTVRAYATEHGHANLNGEFKIRTKTVKAKDLYTDGNSWLEWGYHPQETLYPSPFTIKALHRRAWRTAHPEEAATTERHAEGGQGAGVSVDKAYTVLEKRVGKEPLRNATQSGRLVLVENVEELREQMGDFRSPGEGKVIRGAVDPVTGTRYLVTGNMTEGQLYPTLLHEIGAHGMPEFTGQAFYDKVIGRIQTWAERPNSPEGRAVATARRQVPKNTPENQVWDEVLAYLIENPNNHRYPSTLKGVLQSVMAKIRAWLARHGWIATDRLSVKDVVEVAKGALKSNLRASEGIVEPSYAGASSLSSEGPTDRYTLDMYSTLTRAARRLKQDKATGGQYLMALKKMRDDRNKTLDMAEEMKWTGLDSWLQAQEGQITKDQVIAFLETNGVRLEEVVADKEASGAQMDWDGGEVIDDPAEWEHRVEDYLYDFDNGERDFHFWDEAKWLDDNVEAIIANYEPSLPKDEYEELAAAGDGADVVEVADKLGLNVLDDFESEMREDFEQKAREEAEREYMEEPYVLYTDRVTGYSIVGNDDIGWVVRDENDTVIPRLELVSSESEAQIQAEDHARDHGRLESEDDPHVVRWSEHVVDGWNDYAEHKLILDNPTPDSDFIEDAHFPDENIIAFQRVTERNIGNFGNTYTIDEFQSDWHQAGRQYGYEGDTPTRGELEKQKQKQQAKVDRYLRPLISQAVEVLPEERSPDQSVNERRIEKMFETIADATFDPNTPLYRDARGKLRTMFTDEAFVDKVLDIARNNETELREYYDANAELEGIDKKITKADRRPPDAPFKGKAWLELGLKRALIHAAKNGFDNVAWADANMVADRWSDRYMKMYQSQYDKKMPQIVKELTGLEAAHINLSGQLLGKEGEIELADQLSINRQELPDGSVEYQVTGPNGGVLERALTPGSAEALRQTLVANQVAERGKDSGWWIIPLDEKTRETILQRSYPLFAKNVSPWYSRMRTSLEAKLPGRGTPATLMQQIDNLAEKGEFRKEELEWSGLREWMQEQEGKVSKAEVLAFLQENQVRVEEVTGGEETGDLPATGQRNAIMSYRLPGGENYRELLLTLPANPSVPFDQYLRAYRERFPNAETSDSEVREFWSRGVRVPSEAQLTSHPDRNVFRGSHFDEPNVLAHVRFNERTDADGNRVLFIEELQSDWHQTGRKKGYKGQPNTEGWTAKKGEGDPASGPVWEVRDASGRWILGVPQEGGMSAEDAIRRAADSERGPDGSRVPDAPFKQTWPLLTMKRMIRYASEQGYDKIAWTTGEMQADRYSLSASVSHITTSGGKGNDPLVVTVRPHERSGLDLEVSKDGNVVRADPSLHQAIGKPLSEVVGEEMADKIMGAPAPARFEGDDLKIGGEGMKAFYDQMLPSDLNKYVKKWGAKVGKTTIAIPESKQVIDPTGEFLFSDETIPARSAAVPALPITDQMRDAVLFEGQPLFAVSDRQAFTDFDTLGESTKDWLLRRAQDKFRRFLTLQRAIEEQAGQEIDDSKNVYQAEMLMYGRTEEDMVKVEEDYVDPLVKALANAKIKIEEMDEYLEARHAEERNNHIREINPRFEEGGGSGMTTEEANAILSKLAKDPEKMKRMQHIAGIIDSMNEYKLEIWESAGLEPQQYIDMLREQYQNYVPLKGFLDDQGVAQRGPPAGSGFDIKGKETKRALGRRSRAASPVLNTILDLESTLVRARKNEVGKTLINLVEANPNENVWKVIKAPGQELAKPRYDESRGEVVIAPDNLWWMKKEADDILGVKIAGEQFYVHLKDPLLARAMKNLGEEKATGIIGLMSRLNRVLAAINTSLSPEFVVSNAARDIQTAIANLVDETDAGHLMGKAAARKMAWQVVKDITPALRGAYRNLRHKSADDVWSQWMLEYREAGGKIGFFGLQTLDQKRDKLMRMLSEVEGGVMGNSRKVFRLVGDFIMDVNGAVENAARLAAYKNAREAGLSKGKAANMARNLTVNFNKKGELGVVSNALYLFYNAALQGSARLIVGVARSRKLQILMGGVALAAFALAEINRMIAGDDEDGENYYDKIQDWEKQRNMIFMKPDGSYYKFPLPYGYNVPHVLGETLNALVHGKDTVESTVHMIDTFLESFNPLGTEDSEQLGNRVLKMVSPTVVDPWLSLGLNENFYGAPISPENFPFGLQKPDSHLHFSTVRPMEKAIAQQLNALTGGNPARSGWIDVSPESLEHIVDFFTGSAGRFVSQTAQLPIRVAQPEPMKAKEIPFVRRFYGEQSEWLTNSRYWEHKEEIDGLYYERKWLLEANRPTEQFDKEYGPLLRMRPVFNNAEKALRRLRRRRRIVQSDQEIDEKTKSKILSNINDQIEKRQKTVNRRYNEVLEKIE